MIRGEKVRFDVHNILYSILNLNKKLIDNYLKKIIDKNKQEDISFINNVILNSMRYHFHIDKIISDHTSKK